MLKKLNVNLFRNSNFLLFLKFIISFKICKSFLKSKKTVEKNYTILFKMKIENPICLYFNLAEASKYKTSLNKRYSTKYVYTNLLTYRGSLDRIF
jgi:hypothetical protein